MFPNDEVDRCSLAKSSFSASCFFLFLRLIQQKANTIAAIPTTAIATDTPAIKPVLDLLPPPPLSSGSTGSLTLSSVLSVGLAVLVLVLVLVTGVLLTPILVVEVGVGVLCEGAALWSSFMRHKPPSVQL